MQFIYFWSWIFTYPEKWKLNRKKQTHVQPCKTKGKNWYKYRKYESTCKVPGYVNPKTIHTWLSIHDYTSTLFLSRVSGDFIITHNTNITCQTSSTTACIWLYRWSQWYLQTELNHVLHSANTIKCNFATLNKWRS